MDHPPTIAEPTENDTDNPLHLTLTMPEEPIVNDINTEQENPPNISEPTKNDLDNPPPLTLTIPQPTNNPLDIGIWHPPTIVEPTKIYIENPLHATLTIAEPTNNNNRTQLQRPPTISQRTSNDSGSKTIRKCTKATADQLALAEAAKILKTGTRKSSRKVPGARSR